MPPRKPPSAEEEEAAIEADKRWVSVRLNELYSMADRSLCALREEAGDAHSDETTVFDDNLGTDVVYKNVDAYIDAHENMRSADVVALLRCRGRFGAKSPTNIYKLWSYRS